MNEDHPYQKEWETYRFWWKFHWIISIPFSVFIIYLFIRAVTTAGYIQPRFGPVVEVFFGLIILANVFAGFKLQFLEMS